MFEHILSSEQMALAERLFPELEDFYLAGGTGLALLIGHRRSLDFDLCSLNQIRPFDLERSLISRGFKIQSVFTATRDELSLLVDGTRVTFISFPFDVKHEILWQRAQITLPDVSGLGAMKAYALGRRSKWKDYVDLYFILKFKLSLEELIKTAKQVFSHNFNSRVFREQLCYFDDIDYSEIVEYIDYTPSEDEVKEFLTSLAIRI